MIELIINGRTADVRDDIQINLVKELRTEENALKDSDSQYSYTISLPTSTINKTIFGFKDDFNVTNKFTEVYDAILYVGGVLVLDGKMVLTEISKTEYKGNIYKPSKKSLGDVLSDCKMSDITPHLQYVRNIWDVRQINDWYCTRQTPPSINADGHVLFPYMAFGIPYNDLELGRDNQVLPANLTDDNCAPAYNVCSVIKDVFSTFGYSVSGNIFEDERFNTLYQTIQNNKEWYEGKIDPCFLQFKITNYYNQYSNSFQVFQDTNFEQTIGWDDILRAGADGMRLSNYNDTSNLLKGTDTDGYFISVPKSGWYRIKYDGYITLPLNTAHVKNNGYHFLNYENTYRETRGFQGGVYELRLVKDEDRNGYISNPSYNPSRAFDAPDNATTQRSFPNRGLGVYVRHTNPTEPNLHKFIVNNDNLRMTGDMQNTINGVRFGRYVGLESEEYGAYENMRHDKPNVLNLPNPLLCTEADGWQFPSRVHDLEGDLAFRTTGIDSKRNDHQLTAFPFTSAKNYNNDGRRNVYYRDTNTWSIEQPSRTWQGIANNEAHCISSNQGAFSVDDIVWLDANDILKFELYTPYLSGWSEGGPGPQTYDYAPMVRIHDLNFEMGLLTTNKEWFPGTDEDIPQPGYAGEPTNVNQFLGDETCNAWLQNVLDTFNLTLTRSAEGEYAINYNAGEKNKVNVIDINDYSHPDICSFRSINTPASLEFQFTINRNEAGYVITQEDGSYTLQNRADTTGRVERVNSKYSYNWYVDRNFGHLENEEFIKDYTLQVPLICKDSEYKEGYTLDDVKKNGRNRDNTPRLMYIPYDPKGIIDYASLPLLKSYPANGLRLDYAGDDGIAETFFDTKVQSSYEVIMNCYIPNHIYAQVDRGTLVKFDGSVYRVSKIDKYDPSQNNPCELTLISIP